MIFFRAKVSTLFLGWSALALFQACRGEQVSQITDSQPESLLAGPKAKLTVWHYLRGVGDGHGIEAVPATGRELGKRKKKRTARKKEKKDKKDKKRAEKDKKRAEKEKKRAEKEAKKTKKTPTPEIIRERLQSVTFKRKMCKRSDSDWKCRFMKCRKVCKGYENENNLCKKMCRDELNKIQKSLGREEYDAAEAMIDYDDLVEYKTPLQHIESAVGSLKESMPWWGNNTNLGWLSRPESREFYAANDYKTRGNPEINDDEMEYFAQDANQTVTLFGLNLTAEAIRRRTVVVFVEITECQHAKEELKKAKEKLLKVEEDFKVAEEELEQVMAAFKRMWKAKKDSEEEAASGSGSYSYSGSIDSEDDHYNYTLSPTPAPPSTDDCVIIASNKEKSDLIAEGTREDACFQFKCVGHHSKDDWVASANIAARYSKELGKDWDSDFKSDGKTSYWKAQSGEYPHKKKAASCRDNGVIKFWKHESQKCWDGEDGPECLYYRAG